MSRPGRTSMFKWKVSSLSGKSKTGKVNNNNNKSGPSIAVPVVEEKIPPKEIRDENNCPGAVVQQTINFSSPVLAPRSDERVSQEQPTTNGHHYHPTDASSHSWNEWTRQLLAYTAWVNSQLRKRPELALIEDMGNDLQDGVLVSKLVEIISGKEIRGIETEVTTQQTKRENFDKILAFLASQRVRTSTVTSRDLAAGNLKSLMRLILSLASHYKPHSVKQGRDSASYKAVNATPNLNVPANRRFQSDPMEAEEVMDMKTVNALATLRRQNVNPGATKRLAAAGSAGDLLMSPGVQRRFTMTGPSPHYQGNYQQQQIPNFGSLSNARSLASLQQIQSIPDHHRNGNIASTSVGDLNTSEESTDHMNRKPILKKDSKYGSRRELPTLGISGMVMSKTRPSVFEFWENMTGQQPSNNNSSCTQEPPESNNNCRSSLRRILPPLPGQPSLSVHTNNETGITNPHHQSNEMMLGSRGEVEGSSNQPSPTCLAGEMDSSYWNPHIQHHHQPASLPIVKNSSTTDHLMDDLNRTKKQLAELQNMLMAGQQEVTTMTEAKGTTTTSTTSASLPSATDPDAISWLRTTLHSVDQRCSSLQTDLKRAQQDCLTLDGSRRGLAACLANQEEALNNLRQELVRTTLANQTMTNEKIEMHRKLEEKDRQIADLKRQLAAKDRVIETQRTVLEEASQNFSPTLRAKLDKNIGTMDARRNQYREELQVARDALSSLRSNFRGNDPNHHTLDTLEQCMAFLLERIAGPDSTDPTALASCNSRNDSSLKRVNSSLQSFHNEQFTKVVYFTERTVTPFLTVIPRRLGEISLRDFKTLFDRPGVYRFHFKAKDPEYGFVKEEIGDDDMLLPGFDGKIIAWVEEIQV